MASSATRKVCASDDDDCKQVAVASCEGCSNAFCIKHMNDHRGQLTKVMNTIFAEHNQLKNKLNQQTTKPDLLSFVKEINDWEKESITKIQERAKELRKKILPVSTVHTKDLSIKLQKLSEQLKEGRTKDYFIETDLERWKKTLDNLKAQLILPSTMFIDKQCRDSLVQNISVSLFEVATDFFDRKSEDNVRIEEGGQLATCDASTNCIEIRGKNEYTSGCHEIRLLIENLSNSWALLGINSKSTALQNSSFETKSAYGWSNDNCIWSNGSDQFSNSKPHIEMKTNDVIRLMLDCDNRIILMINSRTNTQHKLIVDVNNCPLPWQLHVVLYESNSSVRILSKKHTLD